MPDCDGLPEGAITSDCRRLWAEGGRPYQAGAIILDCDELPEGAITSDCKRLRAEGGGPCQAKVIKPGCRRLLVGAIGSEYTGIGLYSWDSKCY